MNKTQKKSIIDIVREFVEAECKKPTSKYGYDPFPFHFVPVVKHAKELASEFGADMEIVEIAAWLHDIGSIISGRDDHHLTGAKIAEEKLIELGYPAEKIELIIKCIAGHRGSHEMAHTTLEEQIIVEADVMSNFDNLAGIFQAAFVYEHLDRGEARASVLNKLKRKWGQLQFENSKRIVRPKYEAALVLLEDKY